MKSTFLAFLLAVTLLSASTSVEARPTGFRGIGPRLGFTIDPDQFHIGAHIDFGDISDRLMLIPNIEIGFGDNFTIVAPTFELDYRFREDWGVWTPYLGGGIGPVFYSFDNGASNSEMGLYAQFGVGKGSVRSESGHFFMEAKLGLIDAPKFKATVGWTFGN